MTKGELVNSVAKAANTTKKAAEEAVNATFESLANAIKKEKRFQVAGCGTFSVRARKSENREESSNGALIHIRASRTVGFKPAPNLKKKSLEGKNCESIPEQLY